MKIRKKGIHLIGFVVKTKKIKSVPKNEIKPVLDPDIIIKKVKNKRATYNLNLVPDDKLDRFLEIKLKRYKRNPDIISALEFGFPKNEVTRWVVNIRELWCSGVYIILNIYDILGRNL